MTEWVPRFSVTRPVTVITAFLVITVVGIVALSRIPLQMMPSGWSFPMLWIWVPWQDSTPLEAESLVVRPLEKQLSTVPGIKHLNARASSDWSNVELEFHSSTPMEEAYNDVMDRLERVAPELPSDVEQTFLWRFNPNDEPVIWAGISIPDGEEDAWFKLDRLLRRRLARIPGVGRVDLWGIEEPMVWVDYRRDALEAHRIDLSALITRLAGDNIQLASGRVEDRGSIRLVRGLSEVESMAELKQYPVREGIRLGDVADIRYAAAARADINRINARTGAAFAINKESTANTVEICRRLREVLLELEQDPQLAGYRFPIFFDQGQMVEEALWALTESALEGGVLAVLVLILFLREWRITALIAATIPASLLLTLIVLYFQGRSLNLLSMLGLMLAVGMVVDNAVVVVEAIFHRRQQGMSPVEAAIKGTAAMLLPITLSTMTSIVVFLPVILMSDTTSSLFLSEIGMPVVYIQIGSLLITLLFTPLSTVWLGAREIKPDPGWVTWLAAKVDGGVARILRSPVDALMGVAGMLVLTIAVPVQAVECGGDGGGGGMSDFSMRFEVPPSFTYAERLAVVESFEEMVERNRDRWGVRVYFSRLRSSDRTGRLNVYLEKGKGELDKKHVLDDATAQLPDLPGVRASVNRSDQQNRQSNKVRMEIFGDSTEVLAGLAAEMERRIQGVEGVRAVQTDVETGGSEEVQLRVDGARAASLGLDATGIARTISFSMRGMPLPSWYQDDREIQVQSRFRLEDRSSVAQVLDFSVFSPQALSMVPLKGLVESTVGRGWGTINRRDGRTSLGVTAEFAEGKAGEEAYALVEASLDGMEFPTGYGRERGSEWKEELEDQQSQQLALLLSVVFVFLIMGMLFESFLLPLSVITTVPMAMLGVWWGLWATGTGFDGMAAVGTIILIGIVVNNGIVLVDVITELRAEGLERTEALRAAVRLRLRPILMTALSATVGVIPMAMGDSDFVGIPYAPLGRVVASGMVVATFLTLFFVPWLYAVLDDLRGSGSRWLAWVWPDRRER